MRISSAIPDRLRRLMASGVLGLRLILPHVVGLILLVASLVFWSPDTASLDHFDVVKRWILSFAPPLGLLVAMGYRRPRGGLGAPVTAWILIGWIVSLQWVKTPWSQELDVTVGWLFPFFFFLTGAAMTPRAWGHCVIYLWIVLGIQSVLMVLQYFDRDTLFIDWIDITSASSRMIGTVGYHNQAAAFLALLAGVIWFSTSARWSRVLVLISVAAIIALTGSRGVSLGFFAALLVSGLLSIINPVHSGADRRRAWLGALALIAAIVFIFVVSPVPKERFALLLQSDQRDAAVSSRILFSQIALQMWSERPVTGWGGGSFAYQYIDRLGAILPEPKTHETLRSVVFAREAHNTYLQFAAEFGLVGLLLLSLTGYYLIRTYWSVRSETPRMAGMGIFALVYLGVHAFASFPWQMTLAGPLGALMLGVAWGTCFRSLPTPAHRAIVLHRLALWAAFLLSLFIVYHSTTHARLVRAAANLETTSQVNAFLEDIPVWGYRYQAFAGGWLALQGEYERAAIQLDEAKVGYIDIWLLNNLGHVYSRLGDWQSALHHYQRWADSGLDHRDALRNLSVVHEQNGDLAAALEILDQQRRLWPNVGLEADVRYSALSLTVGRPDVALQVLQRYEGRELRVDRRAQVLNLMGAAWLMTGNIEEARLIFEAVLALDPENVPARRNLEGLARP